jgi:hypothetical protein
MAAKQLPNTVMRHPSCVNRMRELPSRRLMTDDG